MTDNAINPGTRVKIKRGTDSGLWIGHVGRIGKVMRPSEYEWADWVVSLPDSASEMHANTDELEVLP